ncbi:uncharacterized protein PpBr36_06175 [Pyricularia pennisetigena]|uniref:uncharacterized protein n=1 Tax=Pyricularia pennisetigena TaxID=1578925 RepID=UPI001150760D|nr:uncharacterized protein PpBr36_06175 [Pyricularia pennisetigena]TLS22710.1 hypothetical protein PpBr36_06175 [Pyricularia pennisetigena]
MVKHTLHAVWKNFRFGFQQKLDDLVEIHPEQILTRSATAKKYDKDKKHQRLQRYRQIIRCNHAPVVIWNHKEQLRVRQDLIYEGTLHRITQANSGDEQKRTMKIFQLLLCSHRALKLHEIQAAIFMNIDTPSLEHECKLCSDGHEICDSWWFQKTELRLHFTAALHLINSTDMPSLSAEYAMSLLCLQYLTSSTQDTRQTDLQEVKGQTAFRDNTGTHWTDHVLGIVEVADSTAEPLTAGPFLLHFTCSNTERSLKEY